MSRVRILVPLPYYYVTIDTKVMQAESPENQGFLAVYRSKPSVFQGGFFAVLCFDSVRRFVEFETALVVTKGT